MDLLKGKVAFITGASKGIGRAIATLFAEEGARVIITGRNITVLEDVLNSLDKPDNNHLSFVMDVQDLNQIMQVFRTLRKEKIVLDILVNNAGVMRDSMLQTFSEDVYRENFATNVLGTISVTKAALMPLVKSKRGSVINISSIIGTRGSKGQSVYSASKAAILGFSNSMSKELAPLNLRVNCIAPGYIDTDMTKQLSESIRSSNLEKIGMGRLGSPKDVAKVALFLASDLSDYVTGQTIGVDGGMII